MRTDKTNNRRKFIKQSAGIAAIAGLAPLASTGMNKTKNKKLLYHQVYFWMKDGITEAEEEDFLGFFEELRKVPTVKELKVGRPAATEERDVTDHSFGFSLLVTFDSMEDHEVYQEHPFHLKAIEKYSHYWTTVKVYDTREI